MRAQCNTAIDVDDLRWALELGSWLVRCEPSDDDKRLLARALRLVGQRSSAANIRSWCLTRARVLEGSIDIARMRRHNLSPKALLSAPPANSVSILKVLVEPTFIKGVDTRIAWQFANARTGLHIRNGIAHPYDGAVADHVIEVSHENWAAVLGGTTTWSAVLAAGDARVEGSREVVTAVLAAFDVKGLQS